ncbi:hypothetical protein ACOSP7_014248 [Xanthoceras sorbifolium]
MNRDIGMVWGNMIGEVTNIDAGDSGDCLGKFVRVRVMIDVTKPLKRWLRMKLGKGGEEYSTLLCYERLPLIVFLMEIRLDSRCSGRIRQGLGFENCFVVDRIGVGGDLMLLWKSSIEVIVQSFTKGHINALVKDLDGIRWRFTRFYGDPKRELRFHSWNLLSRLGGACRLPWVVGGDFNDILCDEEKVGGLVSHSVIDRFRDAMDGCNLIDFCVFWIGDVCFLKQQSNK